MIDGQTQLYGVIGNPVRHSLSPVIHNRAFRRIGMNAVYLPFEVDHLDEAMRGIRGLGFRGISVTLPFKTDVISFLDGLDDAAKKMKAVNTIRNEKGKLIGYNTDGCGAVEALEEKVSLQGRRVLLLGAGGAARAIAFALKERSCQVLIHNRSQDKAQALAGELGFLSLSCLSSGELDDVQVIVNATAVGLHPHDSESPLPKGLLRPGMTVMDIVYRPLRTRLLAEAEDCGCHTIDGIEMLARQGAAQLQIWTGRKFEVQQIREDLRKALRKMQDAMR